jgi:hypothetical protein
MHRLLLILVGFLSFTAAGFSAQPVGRAAWVMRFDGDWLVAKGMPEKASRCSNFTNASTASSSPR